jgi:hypothetical protein
MIALSAIAGLSGSDRRRLRGGFIERGRRIVSGLKSATGQSERKKDYTKHATIIGENHHSMKLNPWAICPLL